MTFFQKRKKKHVPIIVQPLPMVIKKHTPIFYSVVQYNRFYVKDLIVYVIYWYVFLFLLLERLSFSTTSCHVIHLPFSCVLHVEFKWCKLIILIFDFNLDSIIYCHPRTVNSREFMILFQPIPYYTYISEWSHSTATICNVFE